LISEVEVKKFRLGLLRFLNALPLTFKLRNHPEVEEVWGLPVELTDLLRAGKLDGALTSAYVYAKKYKGLISDLCIASEGRVQTVMLYSNSPIDEIRVIEEDPVSITSNAIVRIIFAERKQRVSFKQSGSSPYRSGESGKGETFELKEKTGRILIGDANFNPPFKADFVYDVATLVWEHFRLPCVFALWQGQRGVDGRLKELIEWAFEEVQKDWSALYQFAEKNWDIPRRAMEDYFQNVLHYRLTDKDKEFLEFFSKRVHDMRLPW